MLCLRFCVFFFFSSRRRHTRYWRDWSSDVCSSDLECRAITNEIGNGVATVVISRWEREISAETLNANLRQEIGRASCRERVEISVVDGSLKKKKGRNEKREMTSKTDEEE